MDAVPGADTPSSAPQTEAVSFMWNGIDEPMAVAVGNSVEDSDAAPSGDAADHPTTATAPQSDVEVLEAGADGKVVHRPCIEHRSCAPKGTDVENSPPNSSSEDNTHSLSASTDGGQSTAAQLTAAVVSERAAELFPGGSAVPVAKPEQPPVVESATNELAKLVFAASKKVTLIRGMLAREDVAGYLAADLLGIELVGEARGSGRESLKIGESVRKAVLAVEKGEQAERNAAAAKRSRMRAAAAKDADRAARLESDLMKLDEETAAACAKLRGAAITLNGMPERNTVLVKRRRVEPAPVDMRRRALEAMWGSQEAADAIQAADRCEDAEGDWTQRDSDDDEDELKEQIERAFLHYKHKLRRLKSAFPNELNDCSEQGECEHRRPCPCGQGGACRGAWPWVVQTPTRGFCEVPRESRPAGELRGMFSCEELHEERQRWVWASAWVGPDKAAARAERDYEQEYRALYSRLRGELY